MCPRIEGFAPRGVGARLQFTTLAVILQASRLHHERPPPICCTPDGLDLPGERVDGDSCGRGHSAFLPHILPEMFVLLNRRQECLRYSALTAAGKSIGYDHAANGTRQMTVPRDARHGGEDTPTPQECFTE